MTIGALGTANTIFGFPANEDVVGAVYNPPDGGVPRWLTIGAAAFADSLYVVTEV